MKKFMITGTVPCFVEVHAKNEEEAWDTFHENLNELTVESFYGHKGIGHPRKDFVEEDIEEVACEKTEIEKAFDDQMGSPVSQLENLTKATLCQTKLQKR